MEIDDGFEYELPLPEEDDGLVDLKFIHWGYLNCCQTLHKGRKGKQEVWNTYWVTLCGTTLRFYLDAALPRESVFKAPPISSFGPLQENQHKVAFFELNGAETKMLDDGKVFRRRLRKSVYSKVYRQHLFQVKLHKINSHYAFQAPSQSSFFTWISKLQESIDAIENNEISFLAEERLELAQYMMEKKLRKEMEEQQQQEAVEQVEETFEVIDDIEDSIDSQSIQGEGVHPRLKNLKVDLADKRELLWQLETQIIDFHGNKGDFIRKEFTTKTTQDYYLVPTRMETYIPLGTSVTIFGQLPNGRWRCLVELDELIKTMNSLVEDLESRDKRHTMNISGDDKLIVTKTVGGIEEHRNNLPQYPLIGSLPASILEKIPLDEDDQQSSDSAFVENNRKEDTPSAEVLSPYSSHNRGQRRLTPLKPIFDSNDIQIIDLEDAQMDELMIQADDQGGLTRPRDSSSITEESNFEEVATADDEESDIESIYDNVPKETDDENGGSGGGGRIFLRGASSDGFLIRKKLRQKGISIVVGSSSSEDESDIEEDIDRINNNNRIIEDSVYRKLHSSTSSSKENERHDWNRESSSFIRLRKRKDSKQNKSTDQLCSDFSTNTDLLKGFGQKSIHLKQDKDLAKYVLKLFETEKGPDVKPPRNERRTLKLHKPEDEGFGFWLQTYGFTKTSGNIQKRTFVRFVEDEGSAYMAGLREGDIIVEVGEQNVEEMEHIKIVELITKANTELKLVVKFIDAVRRVELAVRLKKKQTKLKSKEGQLEQLKQQEYNLVNGITTDASCDSPSVEDDDGDGDSLHNSTESEISSIASSQSDELIVRTSKFAKRSSRVLDSIKELNCNENPASFSISDLDRVATTTEDELLNYYCDKMNYHSTLPRPLNGKGLKRVESMPVQKYRSLPRKRIVNDRESGTTNTRREYAMDYTNTNDRFDSFDYEDDDSSDDCLSSRSSIGGTVFQNLDRTPRRNRPKSYKLAMNSLKHLEGDVAEL